MRQSELDSNCFTFGDEKILALKKKIEQKGVQLKNWGVNIFMGIKTGLNEAFIIDTPTKERLCKQDPKSAEILKPILRGRDIKIYNYKWAGLWLIATFPALKLNIDDYPAIKNYLHSFGKDKLDQTGKTLSGGGKSRKKTGNKWFETQDQIAHYSEFEKEKIVWNRITDQIIFSYVNTGFYVLDSTFMITGKDLKYLIGLLNSKIIAWWIKLSTATLGEGSYGAKIYIEKSPIPPFTTSSQPVANKIITLVDQILSAKKQNPEADTSQLEKEIDQLVYKLYGLTEEEIKIVENFGLKNN
jgi:hypothetical protein